MTTDITRYAYPILDHLKEGFFVIDKNWIVTYWNVQAEAYTGKTRNEVVGKRLWDSFPEEAGSVFHRQYEQAFHTKQPVHFKSYFAGTHKTFHVSAFPVDDLLSIGFLDISPLESQEKDHQQLRLQYAIVTHATTEAVWDWDQKHNRIHWHGDRLKTLLGYDTAHDYTPLEFWNQTIHPDDRDRVSHDFLNAIETGVPTWVQEYRVRKADGTYLPIRNHALLLKENGGGTLRMIGSLTDISRETSLKKQLLHNQEAARKLFEYAPLPQWIFSTEDLRILDVNIAAQHFYGYTKEEFLDMTVLDMRPPEEHPAFLKLLKDLDDADKPAYSLVKHRTRSGEIKNVEVHTRSISHFNRKVRLATIRDLSREESAQQALRSTIKNKEKEVIHADIKGQERAREIIGKELHDNINQVLTSTKLYIDVAQSNKALQTEILNKCKQNLDYAVEEIRKLSKTLVVSAAEHVNLTELLHEVLNTYRVSREFVLHLHLDEKVNDLPNEVKTALFRIFQEQMNNITKHAQAADVWITLTVTDGVQLEIRDNGRGTDLSSQKVGIGMQNIKTRVAAFDGTVHTESAPGQGFLLSVCIPFPPVQV